MFWICLFAYIMLCEALYIFMDGSYRAGRFTTLPAPRWRWLYYLLSFTWGLPMNIVGGLVALVLLCFRKKPKWYGWNLCFELPVNFGLSLGIFFIAPIGGSTHTKNHEHGHSIQNAYFGPFSIGAVNVPSAVRFWIREIQSKRGNKPKTLYDEIWFEGQATLSGTALIDKLNR